MKFVKITISLFCLSIVLLTFCSPLNPVNDFFGIRMNVDEEANFKIVSYNDADGVSYQNSVNMDPSINAWAEITSNEITVKIVNNSLQELPLSYTTDQFILITNEDEYILGKGEKEEYIKKNSLPPNSSQTFLLELPVDYSAIAKIPSMGNQSNITKEIIRDYSKSNTNLNFVKDNIKFIVIKIGTISIVLKRVPENK